MNDKMEKSYLSKREKDIIYNPRTGTEMERALQGKVPIYKYSELCDMAKRHGPPSRVLAHLFNYSPQMVILLQDPKNMSSGHWISVSQNPQKKEIYFFSTYGGKPDAEKVEWLTEDDLKESGQFCNIFNDSMREYQKRGWEIHYNDFPYQTSGDHTATCGIYTAAFLRSGSNPDEFMRQTQRIQDAGYNPAIVYFKRYFM
ncbi:MAG: hypothetical protein J6S85_05995 [Methanobrevibacter sp.]|nr:hypothetical protein [Methanobrevibacter sp.]